MIGLANPVPGHKVTQGFTSLAYGSSGYLSADGYQFRTTAFGGTYHDKVHAALDVGCAVGTPVLAPERMTIRLVGFDATRGLWCAGEIRPGTIVLFQHLSDVLYDPGVKVSRAAPAAKSGQSGGVTGPHVHWAVFRSTATANYLNFLSWMRYDPAMLLVGGKHANEPWLLPA